MASVEELLRNRPGRVAEILRGLPWLECPELCKAITTAVTSFEAQRELIKELAAALGQAQRQWKMYYEMSDPDADIERHDCAESQLYRDGVDVLARARVAMEGK